MIDNIIAEKVMNYCTNNQFVDRAILSFATHINQTEEQELEQNSISEVLVYLQIDFPIIYSFKFNNKYYLAYTLSHKNFIKKEYNMLVTEVESINVLLDLAKGKIGLFDIFDIENDTYYLGFNKKSLKTTKTTEQVNTIFFNCKKVTLYDNVSLLEYLSDFKNEKDLIIEDLLPEGNFKLNPIIPNEKSLSFIIKLLEDFLNQ